MSGVRVPDSPPNSIVAPEARLNGLRFAAAPLLKWAASTLRGALSRRRHYLFLTPPFVHRQRLYSKRSGRLLEFHVRDATDLAVMAQIYRSEDYDLSRLGRWSDIEARYRGMSAEAPQPLILDCGANIGASARYFAEQFPLAKILALEPQADNFRLLERNCSGHAGIVPLQAAVASQDKRGALLDPGEGNWGFRVAEREGGEIELLSINSLLARGEGAPFIVKIDIEGFEAELFSRNLEWLDRFYVLIIELHDWMLPRQRSSQSFLRAIGALDRDFLYAGENVFSIANR
ncbi:MAG: FkbM family methyltransferase [Betaproteobacteria bacterium]|nr:FkbM family methyltransferase [Betaproteobacteria bacterium]